jgi:tRNA A-37 threonylcarbamoyl transferase component Bud32/tetratricopeptide (TPR) repeat protein/TolB-like protein
MTDPIERVRAALADRYSIEREIGQGGMATVYLAHDVRHDRDVAVKVLRSELASALGPERFLREIKIAAKLQHPHILPLHDSGEADGFLYYVMPYVEGQSLRDKLATEGELPIGDAVRIIRDVVDALTEAHANGVVHRDIKPENILLRGRHALVTDFGVAKAVSEATSREQLTTAGVALGTPAYMAPEQAAADPHLDHRVDIYAVGAVAYELLTGRPVFMGTTPQMILSAHVTEAPQPVTKHRGAVPSALEAVVMRCLEKKPADRFQTAEELLPQLEALATPSGGVTPTGTLPLDPVAKRRWMMLGGATAAAAAFALIAIVAFLPRGVGMQLDPDRIVVAVFENATGDAAIDQVGGMAGNFITQGLQSTGDVKVVPWQTARQSSLWIQGEKHAGRVRDPVRALAEETGAGIVVSGTIYLEGDRIQIQAEVTDAAQGELLGSLDPVSGPRDSPTEAVGELRRLIMGFLAVTFDERLVVPADMSGEPPPFEAYAEFEQGFDAYSNSEYERALPHLRRAHELAPTWGEPLLFLVWSLYNSRDFAAADSLLEALPEIGESLTPYYRAYLESVQALLDGESWRALEAVRRAAEMAPGSRAWYSAAYHSMRTNRPREAVEALSTLDPERGVTRGWWAYWAVLADALHAAGESDSALEIIQRGMELFPEWRELALLNYVIPILASQGRIAGIGEVLAEVSEGDAPVDLLGYSLGLLYAYEYPTADSLLQQALDGCESTPSEETAARLHRTTCARVRFLAGKPAEARAILDELVEEYPDSWRIRADRGFYAASSGDTALALADLEWLANLDEPYLFGRHTAERAWITGALGRRAEAVDLLRQAFSEGYPNWGIRGRIKSVPLRDYPLYQELVKPRG